MDWHTGKLQKAKRGHSCSATKGVSLQCFHSIVPFIIALLSTIGQCQSFFESCDSTTNIAAGQTLNVQSPGRYAAGSSCRYTIVAPNEYQVRATCNLNMQDASNGGCSSERFYFARDGRKDLSTSTYYCGSRTVSFTSNGNQMVLAYVSKAYSGHFSCAITTVCDCGWSISSRIVGGTQADVNEFTSMAGLISGTTRFIYCGGTIVSPKYVLTATHCLRYTTAANTAIVVGEHNVKTATDTPYTAVYAVRRFVEHPSYSTETDVNDIGLVETGKEILYSRAVSPACLPFYYTSSTFNGTTVTASGWGSTEYGGPISDVLLKVDLKVLSNAQCRAKYPDVTSSQMCTYANEKDTCQYDSGGPLWYRATDARLFVIGLVVRGLGCGGITPGLNTRVASLLPWIESVVGTGLCSRALS
ncbi:venom serine protease-like isoform X2 [Bradysia coprophila]|uniref:venom serine protease-like isoform X2 n=1 Tax=Bradysia coprophila TaxID=38358 RepID=UPI00187DA55F|nr:venom serine protease-like isoform X2 [Bradysia coprophila]